MNAVETIFLLIGGAAALSVIFMPSRSGGNVNPPPDHPKPPPPFSGRPHKSGGFVSEGPCAILRDYDSPPAPPARPERKHSMDTITITQKDLEAALLRWEQSHRSGETRPYEEALGLTPEQVVREGAAYMWGLLQPVPA